MAGSSKSKMYDWKDLHLDMFGYGKEKQITKESAKKEPAWEKAGDEVGIQIWRIVDTKVECWPKEEKGSFFSGDTFIILNTFKEDRGEDLQYDIHLWIGKHSTRDEYGIGTYKVAELDVLLDDKPIQHREVQGHESHLFKSYFDTITYMEGGAASAFRNVDPIKYEPRLFLVKKTGRRTVIRQVSLQRKMINSGDVFILDLGLTIYQFNGSNCSKDEKYNAAAYTQQLESERTKAKTDVLEEDSTSPEHEFYRTLHGGEEEDVSQESVPRSTNQENKLFRLSNASGKMDFTLEKSGSINIGDFDSNDVFILLTSESLICWIGKNSSPTEKRSGMMYAHQFLMSTGDPLLQITCVNEGQRSIVLEKCLSA